MKTKIITTVITAIFLIISMGHFSFAQVDIKKINEKKLRVHNLGDSITIENEVWMDGIYIGKGHLVLKTKESRKINIYNWDFVEQDQNKVFLDKIEKHNYTKGEQLPNNEIENLFLTYSMAKKDYSIWRIYLTH